MDIKTIIEDRNKKLNGRFVEETHTYTAEDKELKSVTTFKKNYFPFEAEEVAKKLEIYTQGKKTAEEYIEEWNKASEFGTYIHKLVEDYVNGIELTENQKFEIKHAIDFIEEYQLKHIVSEVQLYSPTLGIAGTVDWIAEDKNGNLIIIDWKTSKNITEKNPYEKANFPLNHLDNSKSLGFAYQTSVYKFILDNEYNIPKKINEIMIVQLKLNKTYKVFSSENNKLPYLEEEVVKTLFNHESMFQ